MSRHVNSTKRIRTYNVSTVLQTLYRWKSCTRSQLVKLTGMSPATISRIITQLMDQGIVLEGKVGSSTGGRRPVNVLIDHTKLYIAALKLLRDDCKVAVLDLQGNILQKKKLDFIALPPEQFLESVVASLNEMFAAEKVIREHIIGVGVAASGICHPKEGLVIKSVNLGWENIPIANILGNELQLPIFLENDANACALAEFLLGNARDTDNSMYIKTEEGAGAGIISNSALLTGPRFISGEIAHIPLITNGEKCRCGQQGCLESYVYFGDIQRRFQKTKGYTIHRSQFIHLVSEQDEFALRQVTKAASALALACAHWGILLDLDVITIGGLWGTFETEVIDYCQSYYNNILKQSGIDSDVTITGSAFEDDADLLGAAGLVINHWFDPLSVPFDR